MNKTTACPLDCYDACGISYVDGKIKALKDGHTQGFLCPHMNHYQKYKTIQSPRYKGKEISMQEAFDKLTEILKFSEKEKLLHYRGNANFGFMQEVTDHFFASFGATLIDGSLCDSAGEAGIIEGRGSNKNMPLSEVEKSDVVIFWGRNPHTTSSHILPLIKDKKIIVIDPVKTDIASIADLHIQIKPHGDLILAMLLSRFLYIHYGCDEEYMHKYASEYEEYYELTQTVRIKSNLEMIDVTLGQIGELLEFTKEKKTAIVCGIGIQKYADGADILRAIDAFAVFLNLFTKEGSGVAYLGDSKEGITSPFYTQAKRVSKVDTKFDNFSTVFVQCANPLAQMPDSSRVEKSIAKVENLIYFGLYENETSELADLVIPAKTFLHKNDVRASYSHNALMFMDKVEDSEYGISEYELSAKLCSIFNIQIESEEFYMQHFKSFGMQEIDGCKSIKTREERPYQNGFDTDDGEFLFLDEFDNDFDMKEGMFLITSKARKSLNSQFVREKSVYLHSSLEFEEGELIAISSDNGEIHLPVKYNDSLREDCVLIYSGTYGVNRLTSSKHSYEGKCAIFQNNKVRLSKLNKG